MVCQSLDLLSPAVTNECFKTLHNSGMEHTSLPLKETAVGDLMRMCMFEGVDTFGIEACFIQEFHRLEICEAPM